ncbi:DUF6138 family protein [Kosakonia sp.]|uniref:DUF6138 family protein n=1 Tax=Kosakonia sp. TaxID=1916651 RepID=UPI00289B4E31|nr:DUF6138 family protein [Kosakonia sp.]
MPVAPSLSVERALALVNRWFDEATTRHAPEGADDNPLRAADYALILNCEAQRVTLDNEIGRFRDDDQDAEDWLGTLTQTEVNTVWLPAITALILLRLPKAFSYYRFRAKARFATVDGLLEATLVNEIHHAKIAQLRQAMARWQNAVLEQGTAATDPTSTLFYCSNALNPDLYPQPDIAMLLRGCALIEQRNRGTPQQAEHRHWIAFQLSEWVEKHFLPHYFTVEKSGWGERTYHLKPDAPTLCDSDDGTQPLDLLLYVAVLILRFEPSYSKPTGLQYLALAQQLGSKKAGRYLREGSGALAETVLQRPEVVCSANDVLAHVTIEIREEKAAAWQHALAFIVRLLEQGFPRNYKIKLKSTAKNYLPLKGLARSDTHRFFASALQYPPLFAQLEAYARNAMQQYEVYADAEAEKSCMPGTYATFGLALSCERYFPLLRDYMSLVDEEHQSVQDAFCKVFIERYALNEKTLPVLVACLRCATMSLKLKLPQLEDEQMLRLLVAQLSPLPGYTVEHILFLLWGKREKLNKLAAKARGEKQQLYRALCAAADKEEAA